MSLLVKPPRILTVFGEPRHRAEVGDICASTAPYSVIVDSASATDAVLMLLSGQIDLMLVDVAWSGELLGALERHTRRSAPNARLMAFGNKDSSSASALPKALGSIHPWQDLSHLVAAWLQQRAVAPCAAAPARSSCGS